MKIVVCVKQTPDTEAQIKLTDQNQKLATQDLKSIVNPYDEFAIEEALQIKEKTGSGEVVILSFGPESAKEQVFKGLAMGADRGILISSDPFPHLDSLVVATVLAKVIQQEQADLVLCGKQGIDDDNMHVGVMLAERLDWPHVNVVTKLAISGKSATVEREVEGGQVEVYQVEFPAVLGAHKSLNTPRYTSLPGIMKAKKKPLEQKTVQDIGLSLSELETLGQTTIESYEYPSQKPAGKMFKGEPVEALVEKVVSLLRNEAKVI